MDVEFDEISEKEYEEILKILGITDRKLVFKDHFFELKKRGIYFVNIIVLPELGYKKEDQKFLFKRFVLIDDRIKEAFEKEFYIEWLSLILLKIEFYLRIYLYNKGEYDGMNILNDSFSFGKILKRCENCGMDETLIKEIRKINKTRIQYVHDYLKKTFEYDSIKNEQEIFTKTIQKLQDYINNNSFRVVDNIDMFDEDSVGLGRMIRIKPKNTP